MRRAVGLSLEDARYAFLQRVEVLERENQELRANIARLANENNDLCDRLFDAERALTMRTEAAE